MAAVQLWALAVGIGVLMDKREEPAFPRWVAYMNFWLAFLLIPAGLMLFFKSARCVDGLVTFWVPNVAFFGWIIVMTWLVIKPSKPRSDAKRRSLAAVRGDEARRRPTGPGARLTRNVNGLPARAADRPEAGCTMTTQTISRDERPTMDGFNPLSPEFLTDPYPFFERARREAPVFFHAGPPMPFWVLTKYDDVSRLFTEPATFSSKVLARSTFPTNTSR